MLENVLDHLHNYFVKTVKRGRFEISSGALSVDFLLPGQYFRVQGSILNDGVYQYPAADLKDETFTGQVQGLAIPKAVLDLVAEISDWAQAHPVDDKASESFGGYSYSKATAPGGAPLTWQEAFRGRLNAWRKLS